MKACQQPGKVIEAFGSFVVGGNYVVGFVIFIALIAIQYIVVAHGAVRTAEVTARFTLDAMPGKQMAIDADLNAGLINESQARARREQIAHDAEFYGAMDGAARFNQRDSIATILITAINIIAGFLIGVFQLDIPFREALKTYTVLTVGDGLVTMIPSLLVSMAGGMVVTRATSDSTLSVDVGRQLLSRRPLLIASGVMLSLAAIPGLPKFSFLLLAAGTAFLASRAPKLSSEPPSTSATDKKPAKDSVEDLLKLDELSLEVGYSLVPLVDQNQGGQLLARVKALRQNLAQQFGFIVPPVHITDNVRLKPREYVVALRGVEVARWEMLQDHLMAISSEGSPRPLPGTPTKEPAFGVSAVWIPAALQNQALASGYAVVDQTSVLATHLAEVVKQHAHELLSRQEVEAAARPAWRRAIPSWSKNWFRRFSVWEKCRRSCSNCCANRYRFATCPPFSKPCLIPRPRPGTRSYWWNRCGNRWAGRWCVRCCRKAAGLRVVTIDHTLEEELGRAFGAAPLPPAGTAGLQPPFARRILDGMRQLAGEQVTVASPVLLCSTPARYHLKRLLEPFLPKVVVLSPLEVPPVVEVQSVGVLR